MRKTGELEQWLHWTLPPLSGRLRLVFYGGSLVLFAALNGGINFTLSQASPYLYEPKGLAALLGFPYLPPGAMRALMAVTYSAWLCAAIGLLTRPSKWVTAAGLFVVAGYEQAYVSGSNHTHYLLLYSFVCLAISTSDTEWSLDTWLRRRQWPPHSEQDRRVGLGETGFPRHALLILVVSLYLGSGLSKLVDGGVGWGDGASLQYYIASQTERTSFETVTWLRTWVAERRWITAPLAVGTLVIEIGAPLALISRPIRHLFLLAWTAMHLGILLLMTPNYWLHSWCLVVVLTDWEWLRGYVLRRPGSAPRPSLQSRSGWTPSRQPSQDFRVPPGRSTGLAAIVLLAVAILPPTLQIEWYPFTHVPMYGTYVGGGTVGGIPDDAFGDEAAIREIARNCSGNRAIGYTRRCPWRVPRHLADRLVLTLTGPGPEARTLPGRVDRVRHGLITHLARAPEAPEAPPAPGDLADRVYRLLLAQPPDVLDGFDRFTLEYQLNEGRLLLMEGRLPER